MDRNSDDDQDNYPGEEENEFPLDPADEGEHGDDSEAGAESVTSGSPRPGPVASSLDDAVKTAPVAQLQSLLLFICQTNELARHIASSRLLVPLEDGGGRKRKAFERCMMCDKDYNVLQNKEDSCKYHSGTSLRSSMAIADLHRTDNRRKEWKEEDDDEDNDFWPDHDENCHGRIDDLIDEPGFEEGFKWTCCGKKGDGSPCVRTRHKPGIHEPPTKRARY